MDFRTKINLHKNPEMDNTLLNSLNPDYAELIFNEDGECIVNNL